MPTVPDVPSEGWITAVVAALTATGTGIAIVRGFRRDIRQSAQDRRTADKERRETEDARIDTRADARIEETVTPQIEELKNQIRLLGAELKQELLDSEERRRKVEQEHHEENIVRFATLETQYENLRERRRPPRAD